MSFFGLYFLFLAFDIKKKSKLLVFYRTNQLLANIFLLPYVVVLHLHLFVFPASSPTTFENGVLSLWVFQWLSSNHLWSSILSILLLFVQGVIINAIVINHRLAKQISLFPGLFYILLASSIPEFLPLSPLLLANTFFILSLGALLSVYKKNEVASAILNAGIWTGLASLFYFSYISLIFLGFTGLNILRAFKIRERLMLLSGVFVPLFLVGLYFYWNDQLGNYLQQQFYFRLNWKAYLAISGNDDILKLIFFALVLIAVFLSYGLYTSKQNIQVQKKINILFWAIIFFVFSLAFSQQSGLINLLFLTVPLGILLSFNFLSLKNRNAEVIHLILFASVLFFQYKSWFFSG